MRGLAYLLASEERAAMVFVAVRALRRVERLPGDLLGSTCAIASSGFSTTSAKYVIAVATIAALAACEPRDQDAERDYNKRLGPEGEYTGTHLIIRWPSWFSTPPVTLKIPREYLHPTPVNKDKNGGIASYDLLLTMPEATPWRPLPAASSAEGTEAIAIRKAHWQSRRFVAIERAPNGNFAFRESLRGRAIPPGQGYGSDGMLAGLERYSPLRCLSDKILPPSQSELDSKEVDDHSPPGCKFDRARSLLISPPQVSADEQGVAVRCDPTNCNVYFVAGQRGAKIFLKHEDLVRWADVVEPIRLRVNSFVVP